MGCTENKYKKVPFQELTDLQIDQIIVSKKVHKQGMAHRDQDTEKPLVSALLSGLAFIEFDVYCINNQILVAHDSEDLNRKRTIETQYFNPLQRLIQKRGFIFEEEPKYPLTLFVDVKTDSPKDASLVNNYQKSYQILHRIVTEKYLDIISHHDENGNYQQRLVNLCITGERMKEDIRDLKPRVVTIDGRLEDFETPDEFYNLIDIVSDNFENHFTKCRVSWKLEIEEKQLVKSWMDQAKQDGKKFRLWATKDNHNLWSDLLAIGDKDIIINTDNPLILQNYFLNVAPVQSRQMDINAGLLQYKNQK